MYATLSRSLALTLHLIHRLEFFAQDPVVSFLKFLFPIRPENAHKFLSGPAAVVVVGVSPPNHLGRAIEGGERLKKRKQRKKQK